MRTILLIDDEVGMLFSYGLLLRRNGYHVLEANSGSLGLQMARQHLPDLILSDMNMPSGDGETLLHSLRKDPALKSTQVVLMTGNPELATHRRVMEGGADDFLIKPVGLDALLACMEARFKRASLGGQGDDKSAISPSLADPAAPAFENLTPVAARVGDEGETTAWLEHEGAERIPLHGMCSFGRDQGNRVVLDIDKVSRRHAMIHEQEGEFWLVDLGSTNGVKINGDRVTHPVCLRDGDRIMIADRPMVFKSPPQAIPPAPPLRAPPLTINRRTVADVRLSKCWMLLADLKGFTQMSQQVDPKLLAPIVGSWIADCQAILVRQRGVLAKFLGDGFLAYWTDRKESGVAVAAACRNFQVLQMSAPAFRVVVHFGVISFGGHSPDASHTMIGPELNFAFRLEKVAARLNLPWIFSDAAATLLKTHLSLASCGKQKVPDFMPERDCFTMEA